MTIALWVAAFAVLSVRAVGVPGDDYWAQFYPRALSCLLGAAVCGLMYLGFRPLARFGLAVQFTVALVASAIIGVIYGGATYLIFVACLPPAPGVPGEMESPLWLASVMRGQGYLWIFMTWCCAYLALAWNERARDNELRLVEAQALAADAQNRMLRYQINPHFLFNTLNALHALMQDREVDRGKQVVLALADFLRFSLARSPDEKVTLLEEIEAQLAYLTIEQVRFGDRLRVVQSIDPAAAGAAVPSMILQPLVENAVKYAVAPSARPVTLDITARVRGGFVEIEVGDDGQGAKSASPSLGVGLDNVRRRLRLAWGEAGEFRHGPRPLGGYAAIIRFPLEARP